MALGVLLVELVDACVLVKDDVAMVTDHATGVARAALNPVCRNFHLYGVLRLPLQATSRHPYNHTC